MAKSFAFRRIRFIGPQRLRPLAWLAVIVSVTTLCAAFAMPLWLPRTVRSIIPDRYIAAYAPKAIQDIIFIRGSEESALDFAPHVSGDNAVAARKLLVNSTPNQSGTRGQPNPSQDVANTSGGGATPSPTPTPPPPVPASYSLGQANFIETPQKWNNCGPATLTMLLSYWGVHTTQDDVAEFVKPNPEDRNVRPDELAAYVESRGFHMIVRENGDMERLRRFIASGYPVMIEKGFDVEDKGWMGHYVLLYAYSDKEQVFSSMDSYLGGGHKYTYQDIERYWHQFNNTYLIAYPPQRASEVASIIGSEIDDKVMVSDALDAAKETLAQNPDDIFGWFNLGSDLVALGDYQNASLAFDTAFQSGKVPWRMLWYQFGPYEAYLHVGRYADVQTLADRVLFDNVYSEEAYYYKSLAYSATGEVDQARRQLNLALLYNKNFAWAQTALAQSGN